MDFYQRLELGYALREGRAGKEFPAFPDGRRVDLKRFGWKPSMEEAELLYEMFLRKEKEKKRQQGERYDGEKE